MVNYKTYTARRESGFALIMALVISSVVLSIGLSMLSVAIKQIDLSSSARESEVAFQVASAAMECALMTRIREEEKIATDSPDPSIQFACGSVSASASRAISSTNVSKYEIREDWTPPSGQARYMNIEMFVVDAVDGSRTFNRYAFSDNCAAGNYCTYIFAQGYNRSQDEVTSGASFTVQRELTAEF